MPCPFFHTRTGIPEFCKFKLTNSLEFVIIKNMQGIYVKIRREDAFMKAYQLKIAINDSKPPIWRRCIVPAGITFSQLAVILNQVMGWSGAHLSEFEFYHLELRIMDDMEEYEMDSYDKYDLAEASSTYIREYMEENDWFSYIYDFGDYWKHRVTVEKILPDYPLNHPQVIKYKGPCPMEDCGGIGGYYECLSVMSDENHPEYEERNQWARSQGYEPEYDMEAVNQELETSCFLVWGKGDKRTGHEIYMDFFAGKYGLKATKSDKNKKLPVRSKRHRVDDSLQAMADLLKEAMGRRQLKGFFDGVEKTPVFLREILLDYTKNDLSEIAERKGMEKFAQYGKERLVAALSEEMLKPEEAEKYFVCLSDEELDAFEAALKCGGITDEYDKDCIEKLYQACYISLREDGVLVVPEDVQFLYPTLKTRDFEIRRRRISGLLACFKAAAVLDGIIPADILVKFYASATGEEICVQELMELVGQIPAGFMKYVYKNGRFYNIWLYPNDRGLLAAQGRKKFYIPTGEEIRDLGRTGYLPNDLYLKKFIGFLKKDMGAGEKVAEFIGMHVQHTISGGCRMQDVFDILEENGIECRNGKEQERLAAAVNLLWNHTRMLLNRGFTPNELSEEIPAPAPLRAAPPDNVIQISERSRKKTKKIYPNDPCPCGSGKKYKNCCGKADRCKHIEPSPML